MDECKPLGDGGGGGEGVDALEPLTSLRHVREILLQARGLYQAGVYTCPLFSSTEAP